ncbi:MAG: methyltransferase domain-containing protein [Anaeromyxobacter sp.]
MNPTDFDAKAATWDDDPAKRDRALRVAEAIAAAVPDLASREVLEYGAGTGLLGFALLPLARRVTLADSSREMLAVADRKAAALGAGPDRLATRLLDLTAGALPPERYGLVCNLMVLHHLPDTEAALRSFHALLAPGGAVALCDLEAEDGSFHGAGVDVHHGFDPARLVRQLEAAGFQEVSSRRVMTMQKDGRSFPLFLAIGRRA